MHPHRLEGRRSLRRSLASLVLLDTLIFRPAHWLGSKESMRTIFGHTDED